MSSQNFGKLRQTSATLYAPTLWKHKKLTVPIMNIFTVQGNFWILHLTPRYFQTSKFWSSNIWHIYRLHFLISAFLPWYISTCLLASPRAENKSSFNLVSALRLFSRCEVLSCIAASADINTSVSLCWSLYWRNDCNSKIYYQIRTEIGKKMNFSMIHYSVRMTILV